MSEEFFVVELIKRFFLFYLKFRDCCVRVYKSVRKRLGHTVFCIILPGVTVQYIMSLYIVQLGPCCKVVQVIML